MTHKPFWYIRPDVVAELAHMDEDDVLEFLREARREIDDRAPRNSDAQIRVALHNFNRWSAAHWAMFSMEHDEDD